MASKGGRPKQEKRGMSKRDIIKEVSDKTELRYDVVLSVFNCLIDIFIREVILNEFLQITNWITIQSHLRKSRKTKDLDGNPVTYPATRVLSVKLSPKINYFFRWKIRNERNAKNGTTVEDWKQFYEDEISEERLSEPQSLETDTSKDK